MSGTVNTIFEKNSSRPHVPPASGEESLWEADARRYLDRVASSGLAPSGNVASIMVAHMGVGLLRKALNVSLKLERRGGYLHDLLKMADAQLTQKEMMLQSAVQRDVAAFDQYGGALEPLDH